MKLKTLKDLHLIALEFDTLNLKDNEEFVLIRDLKAEAIKWYKRTDCILERSCVKSCCLDATKNFIKHFFNLTKEDLK